MATALTCVTGLPRSGSTLLCQLLAQHPKVYSEGYSSPLCNMLLAIRRMVSDDSFFLAQLDQQFDLTYAHLSNAMQGFLNGWVKAPEGALVTVDKNRAWLHAIEMTLQLDPSTKMLVTVRELGQIYGSIESQHQRTILVDFIDHLADYDRFGRADMLFAKDKTIGAPLLSVQAMEDLPEAVKRKIYIIRFEDLIERPVAVMNYVYQWLGLPPHEINPRELMVGHQESDSHYRMKYLHRQQKVLSKPQPHEVPSRIQSQIEQAYAWFYELYYPKYKEVK